MLERRATLDQFREFRCHRSAYQLKEADPSRMGGPAACRDGPKEALVEIQADEYGGGRPGPYARNSVRPGRCARLGLDANTGRTSTRSPGYDARVTVNLMSYVRPPSEAARSDRRPPRGYLRSHHRSPNGRYARGLRRLGAGPGTPPSSSTSTSKPTRCTRAVAAHDLAAGVCELEPELAGDILFGASSLLLLDAQFAAMLLTCWERGETSLRTAPDVALVSDER